MARRSKKGALGGRTRWIAFGLVLWIAVIVVGAGAPGDDAYLGVSGLGAVWLILMVLMALLGLALLIWLNPFSNEFVPPDKPRGWVAYALLIGLVALFFWKPELLSGLVDAADEEEDQQAQIVPAGGESSGVDEAAPDVVAEATDLLFLVLVIGAAGGVLYFTRRTSQVDPGSAIAISDETFETDMAAAVEQITTELIDGHDPRTAVLNAYAVLEATLGTHGSYRGRSETPTEHVRRSVTRLRVDSGPLIQLVRLYEIARFSEQTITAEQQQHSAQALESVRQELERLP